MAFLDISNKVAKSLVFSRPLLAFPTITYFDPLLARGILNGGTQILIMSIVIVSIVMGFQIDVILNLPLLASSALMALCLAFGIGTLNCFLFMRYPFWERVWSIVTRPLLFVSCIFYLFESIPEPYASVLWLNPLVHIVGEMRRGIYVTYQGEYVSHVYVYLFGLLPLLFGLLLLRRHYRDLVHN